MLKNDVMPQNVEGFAFLSQKELQTLSGYQQKAGQMKWLDRNGIAFLVNRLGYPVVSRSGVMELLSVSTRRRASCGMPDLDALRTLENGTKKA